MIKCQYLWWQLKYILLTLINLVVSEFRTVVLFSIIQQWQQVDDLLPMDELPTLYPFTSDSLFCAFTWSQFRIIFESDEFQMMFPGGWLGAIFKTEEDEHHFPYPSASIASDCVAGAVNSYVGELMSCCRNMYSSLVTDLTWRTWIR